jgi:hypothetical protein
MHSEWKHELLKNFRISLESRRFTRYAQTGGQGDLRIIPQISTQIPSSDAASVTKTDQVQSHSTSNTLFQDESDPRSHSYSAECPTTTKIFPFNDPNLSPRTRLRQCWFHLSWLARCYAAGDAKGEWAQDLLMVSHRAALVELITAGKMNEAIARDIQKGYDLALSHIHTGSTPVVCFD